MSGQLAMISNLFNGDGIIVLLVLILFFGLCALTVFLLLFFLRSKPRKEVPPPLPRR